MYFQAEEMDTPEDLQDDNLIDPGGEKPHYCCYCGSSFQKVRDLIRHQRSHTGEKPQHCSDCDRSFVLFEKLEKQQLENTFKATSCVANVDRVLTQQRTFSKEKEEEPLDTDDSDEWIEGFSPGGEKPHYCSDCSKSFRKVRDLIRHQRLHTGEKPQRCPVWDKSFARLDKLKLHNKIHMKEEHNVTHNHQTELNVDRVHTQQRTASKGRQKSKIRTRTPGEKMVQLQPGKDLPCKSS
ncbi:unnamed protein product, partial [Coregonus sp. 'balchen']